MEALQALMRKKDALEAEAESLTEQLSASNMGGASGPLVDREGFPRADVDVHATRLLRNQLACLTVLTRTSRGLLAVSTRAQGSLLGKALLPCVRHALYQPRACKYVPRGCTAGASTRTTAS
jgi:hypothetical protein